MKKPTSWHSNKWPLHAGIILAVVAIICCGAAKLMGGPWY